MKLQDSKNSTRAPLLPAALVLGLGIGLLLGVEAAGAAELDYYLPEGVEYDDAIPTPDSVLGFDVGDWHVRHDLLVQYMRTLAEASDRAVLEIQGHTHERRPQPLLIVTSPENHARLEEIRLAHVELTDPTVDAPTAKALESMPVVVFLGYSIHGNEASGANASLLATYHFVAGQGADIEKQLDEAVILFDPSLNPDGIGRFAQWANMHRSTGPLVADSSSREHNEVWPGGRTNHYWFDLNRDWLLLQHPESRNRVRTLHRWKPNLVGDFHEMGTNSTFFFQPGVPSRKNPLIPQRNVEITNRLAEFHARALEADQRLFYTEEGFDDFYPGKGSTYPDVQGAIGILFEQASSRGHLQESVNGDLSFSFGIKNQFLASLSMVEGVVALRKDFLDHQITFFRDAYREARSDARGAFVYQTAGDPARAHLMDQLLARHQIEVFELASDVVLGDLRFSSGTARIVPLLQPQYTLIRSLFEETSEYEDSTFYDVSSWTLPLAFDADSAALGQSWSRDLLGEALSRKVLSEPMDAGDFEPEPSYAYLFEWNSFFAPRALNRLQRAGVKARVATRPFTATLDTGARDFDRGTVLVQTGMSGNSELDLPELLAEVAQEDGIDIYKVTRGLTPRGIDIGSSSFVPLTAPRPAILGGRGMAGYEAGEIWHLLDHRFGVEVPVLDVGDLPRIDLDRYTHLLLPSGSLAPLSTRIEAVTDWIEAGGVLVAQRSAATWVQENVLDRAREMPSDDETPAQETEGSRRSYADYSAERAQQLVSGAIVQVELDLTHPIAYGVRDSRLPVFRTWATLLPKSENPYENVGIYSADPHLSGFISSENRDRIGDTAAIVAARKGRGLVVQFMDNLNFRAYFHGSMKVYLNSLFFSDAVGFTTAPDSWLEEAAE